MNRLIIIFILLIVVSCKNEKKEPFSAVPQTEESSIETGKKIFEGKGQCATCHKSSQSVLGPSIKEIVSIYKEQEADMVEFLKGNLNPIVDPAQFPIMLVNLEITKKMTDEELQAVVDYMYHISEK